MKQFTTMEDVMEDFTINRSLCEVEFVDKDLKSIDVDVMEYVWVKIRDHWLKSRKDDSYPLHNYVEIGFSEIEKCIGRYRKDTLIESVKRIGDLTIVTNQKSDNPSERYNFTYSILDSCRGFKVTFDNNLFDLFNKPKQYNVYDQKNIFDFNEKYSKLLYRFLIGYKRLVGRKIFIDSDVLMKILNVNTDKPMNKIQSDIFQSSFQKIREKTGLDVELMKNFVCYKNGSEIVRYTIKFNSYEGGEKHSINRFLFNIRKNLESQKVTEESVPAFVFRHNEINEDLFINDSYKIVDIYGVEYTGTLSETYNRIKEWQETDNFDYRYVEWNGYPKTLKKHCLLSEDELKKRGLI